MTQQEEWMPKLYTPEVSAFLAGRPWALPLWEAAAKGACALGPEVTLRVSKTQISFRTGKGFAFFSFPFRRVKGRPGQYAILSFGLARPLESPRIVESAHPTPKRWTHHMLLEDPVQVDEEALGWLREAYLLSLQKRL